MDELKRIKSEVRPHEILLVVDAMTGQDAVNVASTFNETLGIDGLILTKLDGDTRGGAALSARAVTGKPIKFVGVGEKLGDLDTFHPDRMASRILGMGDVLSLIEKAETAIDEKKAAELEEKIRKNKFDLNDLLDQITQLRKMGSIQDTLAMLPGMGKKLQGVDVDEKQFDCLQALIRSMTPKERENPDIINPSRKGVSPRAADRRSRMSTGFSTSTSRCRSSSSNSTAKAQRKRCAVWASTRASSECKNGCYL